MALFGFGKKEDRPMGVPTDKVLAMRQQGLSNNQIIQNLQTSGHDPNQIFDALNQADLKGSIESVTPPEINSDIPTNPMDFGQPLPQPVFSPPPTGMPEPPRMAAPMQPPEMPDMSMPSFGAGPGVDRIEEIAEAIIDEKWNELVRSINKIIEWKDRTEMKINQIEQKFVDLKNDFDNLNRGVLGKVGEYDKNLVNIGIEIKAMERVFQKVLPSFTENVHTLDRVTRDLQGMAKK
jgi:prefoldin subunit 5